MTLMTSMSSPKNTVRDHSESSLVGFKRVLSGAEQLKVWDLKAATQRLTARVV